MFSSTIVRLHAGEGKIMRIKCLLMNWFGKRISKIFKCRHIDRVDFPFVFLLTNKIFTEQNVL